MTLLEGTHRSHGAVVRTGLPQSAIFIHERGDSCYTS